MMDTPTKGQDRAGNWTARGLTAAGRGIALAGLTLAAIGLWAVLLTVVAFASLGIGLPAIPRTLRAMRRLENTVRRRTGDWCGVAIGVPYLPEPAAREERSPGRVPGLWRQLGALLADQATWRDLLWTAVDICAGYVLTLTPAGLGRGSCAAMARSRTRCWHPPGARSRRCRRPPDPDPLQLAQGSTVRCWPGGYCPPPGSARCWPPSPSMTPASCSPSIGRLRAEEAAAGVRSPGPACTG